MVQRVAVTGATGFIGSHLVPLLAREGYEVRGLHRTEPVRSSPDVSAATMCGDVRSPEVAQMLLGGCDYVVHLAAGFSPHDDLADIIITGTRNILTAAQAAGVTRLVFMSCLGADAAAQSPFFAAKWQAESLVRGSQIPHVILRPSLVLGRGDRILQPLARLVCTCPVVPVPGKGDYRQQPIDVDDLARCVLIALTGDSIENELVSLGGPVFITFRQLVDLVSGRLGILKPKALVPYGLLPAVAMLLPDGSRDLFLQPRAALFQHGVVASPGIVHRVFGFEPASIVRRLEQYLD